MTTQMLKVVVAASLLWAASVQAASADGSIDNWLINRLFGRR